MEPIYDTFRLIVIGTTRWLWSFIIGILDVCVSLRPLRGLTTWQVKCLSLVLIPVLTTTLEDPHTKNDEVMTPALVSCSLGVRRMFHVVFCLWSSVLAFLMLLFLSLLIFRPQVPLFRFSMFCFRYSVFDIRFVFHVLLFSYDLTCRNFFP